jgi:hypothetical protein
MRSWKREAIGSINKNQNGHSSRVFTCWIMSEIRDLFAIPWII